MPARVTWNPAPLNAAILRAFPPSVREANADALAHRPTSKAGARARITSATHAVLVPTGLGFVFEGGRKGGYPIVPGGAVGLRRSKAKTATLDDFGRGFRSRKGRGTAKAIKFTRGDGGFAAYSVGGDMSAQPYVGPAGARWARGGFQRAASRSLSGAGFRRR